MLTIFEEKVKMQRNRAIEKNQIVRFKREDLREKEEFCWYQTDKKIGIDVWVKVEKKQELKVVFGKENVEIEYQHQLNKWRLEMKLNSEIIPDESISIVHLDRIQIQMEKKMKGHSWPKLLISDEINQISNIVSQYPTSSLKKKNWQKMIKQIQIQAIKNKQDGQDGANSLFKAIYANSDDKTRLAMKKSFQTSDGTVLSTDYQQVMSKDYSSKDRPSPQKGCQIKKY